MGYPKRSEARSCRMPKWLVIASAERQIGAAVDSAKAANGPGGVWGGDLLALKVRVNRRLKCRGGIEEGV